LKFKVFRLTHKNGIEVNFTSILMSVFGFKEPSSKELGCSPQTPTLIGCIFLRIEAENFFFASDSLRSVKSCIIAQLSLHFQRFLRFLLYPAQQEREENARR